MKKTLLATVATVFVLFATTANGTAVYDITGLSTEVTTGATMTGISVKVTSSDGITYTSLWDDIGGGYYGVSSDAWGSLSMLGTGNSYFYSTWDLNVTADGFKIGSIVIDALVGDTVFDVWDDDDDVVAHQITGSENSHWGDVFDVVSGDSDNLTATYGGQVGIAGAGPVGDLWSSLSIVFDADYGDGVGVGGTTGDYFGASDVLSFKADTDTLTPVPEPATVLLFGLGLTGLVGYNRRRSNNKS